MKLALVAAASVVLLSTSLLSSASPATAVPMSPGTRAPSADIEDRTDALLAGVDERSHTFDGRNARSAGAAEVDIVDFAAGYLAAGGRTQGVRVPAAEVDQLRAAVGELRCSGRNSADVTGLQANLYLNSCNANKIVSVLAGGAGLAAIAGFITGATGIGAAAAGIAAGVLTIGSAAIAYCNAKGRGIGFHVLPVGAPWCASQ